MAAAPAPSQAITEFFDGDEEDTVVVPVVVDPKPPVKPAHHPRVVQEALDYGLSDAEVQAQTPDQLADLVYHLNRQTREAARRESRLDAQERDLAAARARPAQVAAPVEDEPFDLDPADYDPKVYAKLKWQHEQIQALKKDRSTVEGLVERERAREQRTVESVVDDAFDALGPDFKRAFGDGGMRELKPDSPEFLRRKAVFQAAGVDWAKGPSPRQVQRAIRAASEAMFGQVLPPSPPPPPVSAGGYGELEAGAGVREPVQRPRGPDGKFVPDSVVREIEKDWATATAVPTHRRGAAEPKGVAKAERSLGEYLRNNVAAAAEGESGFASPDDFL